MKSAIEVAVAIHRSVDGSKTLLVDNDIAEAFIAEDGVVFLSQSGLAPEEMWACQGVGSLNLVVLSAVRTAREMYRVLSLAERLVVPTGKILLLPVTDSPSDEVRPEATEIFCGVYPEWSRRQIEGNVVELQKAIVIMDKVDFRSSTRLSYGGEKQIDVGVGTRFDIKLPQSEDDWKATSEWLVRGKRVVSLSVFGDSRFGTDFWKQMPAFVTNYVLAHHALFPGYELRVHHDEHLFHTNAGDVLCGLARCGLVRLVYVPSRPGQGGCERMLHRLIPVWDPEVEYVICRDVDSLPTWRDMCAVGEFVASGLDVHTILDSCSHMGIMGGLCAFRAKYLRDNYSSFKAFIYASTFSDKKFGTHGSDQLWLNTATYKARILEHNLPKDNDPRYGIIKANQETWRAGKNVTVLRDVSEVLGHDNISLELRNMSNALINHMGSSGYDIARARDFYNQHSPIAEAVRNIEKNVAPSTNRVVLGCDTNSDYSFYLPVACRLWAKRGYRPLVLLVGEPTSWLSDPKLRLIVERTRETSAEIYWLGDFDGVRTSTVAQVARIFAACAPGVAPDDYILTSDVDMLPLGPWVGGGVDQVADIHLWYSNAYDQTEYPHYPMCYVGARARTWIEIVEGNPWAARSPLVEVIREGISQAPADAIGAWNYDERLLGQMISRCRDQGAKVQEIPRTFIEGGQQRPKINP